MKIGAKIKGGTSLRIILRDPNQNTNKGQEPSTLSTQSSKEGPAASFKESRDKTTVGTKNEKKGPLI